MFMKDDIERVLLSEEEIQTKVSEIGKQISLDFEGKNPIFVGVLKGCFIFMADLMRNVSIPCSMDFMAVSSYSGTTSTGAVKINKDLSEDILGRHLILVEDIARRKAPIQPDYSCFQVPDAFVVGYGLDYDERYRNLPYIGILKPKVYS